MTVPELGDELQSGLRSKLRESHRLKTKMNLTFRNEVLYFTCFFSSQIYQLKLLIYDSTFGVKIETVSADLGLLNRFNIVIGGF